MIRVALMADIRSLGCAVKRQTAGIKRVDYSALLQLAEQGIRRAMYTKKPTWKEERSLVFAVAYLGPSENTRQRGLVTSLNSMGYTVKICENTLAGYSKSNTDLIMLRDAHALIYGNKIDILVLATADSDFYLVIQTARTFGVRVELVSVEGQVVRGFIEMADCFADCGRARLLRAREDVSVRRVETGDLCLVEGLLV
ncbi:MAG: NYN domain-containing protein [Anaerolineales bacterium]|nr:NYN domain-containing protein [Anaerolineales bacterium]